MNPNLTTPATFSYKDILLKKLYHAVSSSVISQLVILVIYIFISNVNIFHPVEWVTSALDTFTYVSTWVFVVVFMSIIFSQCIICAKDYVLMSSYCSTRFQQFLHIFSMHNFILLLLHVVIGGVLVWQISSVVDSEYRSLITTKNNRYCLVGDTFFLILGGFWTGLYFFLRIYVASKHLVFPVIQQRKFLNLRSNLFPLLKESFTSSIWPTVYFAFFYYVWGHQLELRFIYLFGSQQVASRGGVFVYLYCWWFAALYFFSMNLMRFFFYLFLTEAVEFPLFKANSNILTLQDAMVMSNLPIIQNLACLDLFLLSQWAPQRRQVLFTLSQPGGHPHNWNSLIESVLKLFTEYTDLLKKSTEDPSLRGKAKPGDAPPPAVGPTVLSPAVLSPLMSPPRASDPRFRNMRNMTVCNEYLDVVDVTHNVPENASLESLKAAAAAKANKILSIIKILLGINYLFGELPEVNIQKCLATGHLVIWASQGIAEVMARSLTEDKYGVVQKDLPVVITSLVQLKQNLDKLNKIPALCRKVASLDDFNYKMKNAVSAAVKRSLFNICLNFGGHFNEFALNKDTLQYLQSSIMLVNCQ